MSIVKKVPQVVHRTPRLHKEILGVVGPFGRVVIRVVVPELDPAGDPQRRFEIAAAEGVLQLSLDVARSRGRQVVVFTTNGRRVHTIYAGYITERWRLDYLARHAEIIVDCDEVDPRPAVNRRFVDAPWYAQLEDEIVRRLRDDVDLVAIERNDSICGR